MQYCQRRAADAALESGEFKERPRLALGIASELSVSHETVRAVRRRRQVTNVRGRVVIGGGRSECVRTAILVGR